MENVERHNRRCTRRRAALARDARSSLAALAQRGCAARKTRTVGYAFKLRSLLEERYTAQTFSVTDEGNGAERIARGLTRLPDV